MRLWSLLNARNPVWRGAGAGILALVAVGTGIYVARGPGEIRPKAGAPLDGSIYGRQGTYTELLGKSRFLLDYESVIGEDAAQALKGVHGRLEEPGTLWLMTSPSARKSEGIWYLDGPMDMEARDPKTQAVVGKGRIAKPEPGLKWDRGIWLGLSTLVWEDIQGSAKGRWTLPPGWRRELDGRFVVEHKPVHWEALEPGALKTLDAMSLWTTLGFSNGRLEEVKALMEGGQVQAPAADIDPETIRWTGPIHFQRDDGWNGEAESGIAPRPPEGGGLQQLDLKDFNARRSLPEGPETMRAEGARWTPAGIQAEGNVVWDQPKDGQRMVLRAPRVLMREGKGAELPADLPLGEARAEGLAVLTWGPDRTLSSPQIDVQKLNRNWRLKSPVLGRGEQGTFSASAGRGTPLHWEFDGPVRATTLQGGNLRGDRLVWEDSTWTVTGRPATWNGIRERLTGARMVLKGDLLQFPDGIGGALASADGDVVIRADRGSRQGQTVILTGRVDCQGQDWRLQSDRVTVQLGTGNEVKTIAANGGVTLRGRISEGQGEILTLDLGSRAAKWQGRVRGLTEVRP